MTPTIPKPSYGSPCNGCGRCCVNEQCPLSLAVFGELASVCPALAKVDEVSGAMTCDLIREPRRYLGTPDWSEEAMREAFGAVLGVGHGCDAVSGPADQFLADLRRPQLFAAAKEANKRLSAPARAVIEFLRGAPLP